MTPKPDQQALAAIADTQASQRDWLKVGPALLSRSRPLTDSPFAKAVPGGAQKL